MHKLNLIYLVVAATLVCACSGGSSSQHGSSQVKTTPYGPISYLMVADITNTLTIPVSHGVTASIVRQLKGSPVSNITFSDPIKNQTNCVNPIEQMSYQSSLGEDSKILSFFGNMLSFIPVAGSYLSFGTSVANFGIGQYLYNNPTGLTACLSYSDEQFTNDFNVVQNEITGIESQVTDIDGQLQILLSDIVTNAKSIAGINNQNLNQAELYITGSSSIDGMTQNFLKYAGLTNQSGESTGISLMQMSVSGYSELQTMVVSDSTSYQISLMNLSGTQVNNSCSNNCYQYVSQDQNSALILTYQSIYNSYKEQIQQALSNNQNIVPLIQNYNNTLVYLYQQSMVNLQSAYSIEFMINQANYFAAIRGLSSQYQVPSLSNSGGTYYTTSTTIESSNLIAQTNDYNLIQQQLSLLYAAKFNQLYINTIQYIMSDPAASFQVESGQTLYYDVNGVVKSIYESNGYIDNISKNVITPISLAPGNSWKEKNSNVMGILYQFDGLRNSAICTTAITNYVKNESNIANVPFNNLSCPVLFNSQDSTTESGFYNGINLVPYVANYNTSSVSLTESVNNLIAACNIGTTIGAITGDFYFWMPSATNSPIGESSGYLMCNLWNQSFSSTYNTQLNNIYSGGAPYIGEFHANGFNTFIESSENSFPMTPLFASESSEFSAVNVGCYSYGESIPLMAYGYPLSMSGPISQCGNNGSTLWAGYPNSPPLTIAVQTELPFSNGFIAPLILAFEIDFNNGIYVAMPYCNLTTPVTVKNTGGQDISLCTNINTITSQVGYQYVQYLSFAPQISVNVYGPNDGPGFGFYSSWAFYYK